MTKAIIIFLLFPFAFFSQEKYLLNWSEKEWKMVSSANQKEMSLAEFVHPNETADNWTELGTSMSLHSAKFDVIDSAMAMMKKQILVRYEKAKITFLEKNVNSGYPFIMFTVEVPQILKEVKPESQVWHIMQGKTALYCSFISVRKSSITKKEQMKWSSFLKTASVVE